MLDAHVPVCFALLMSELTLFSAIVCPMPFTLRKKWVFQLEYSVT